MSRCDFQYVSVARQTSSYRRRQDERTELGFDTRMSSLVTLDETGQCNRIGIHLLPRSSLHLSALEAPAAGPFIS